MTLESKNLIIKELIETLNEASKMYYNREYFNTMIMLIRKYGDFGIFDKEKK